MLLRSQDGKPAAAKIPLAMTLIASGMMFIVFGIVWPRFISLSPYAGTNWDDFLRGLCYGLGIALDIGGVVLSVKAAAAVSAKKS